MPLDFQNKYADFGDLSDLATIFDDEGIVVAEGCYDEEQQDPGPHVLFISPNSKRGYDFIKQSDGSYVVRVRNV